MPTAATDTFTRANSASAPGTTETGSLSWTVSSGGTWGISSNQLYCVTSVDSSCTVDTGSADGTLQLTFPGSALNRGLAVRMNSGGTQGYVVWRNATGTYELAKKNFGYTSLATSSGVTPGSGDVVAVVLSGNSIIVKVNGTTAISTTDSTYATNTYHGAWSFTANDLFDSFSFALPAAAAASGDRVVYAEAPPTGLNPVLASNSASANATALAAQGAYVASTWGSGRVVLPSGENLPCGPLGTWPAKVELSALESTTLDMSSLTGTQTGITISDSAFTPLRRVIIKGPGKTSTTTGLSITGSGLCFDQVGVREWGTAVNLVHANTYIISFLGGGIGESGTCVDLAVNGVVSNSGEKILFDGVTFFNSPLGLNLDTGGGSVLLKGCSIDYCTVAANLYSGHTEISGCHIESSDTASTGGYLFNADYNSVTTFNGTRFIMGKFGSGGLRWIINPAHGPWNYAFGRVTFGPGNRAFFFDSGGTGRNVSSDELIFIGASTTSTTIETPFVHKWGPVVAAPAWNDGTTPQAGITITPSSSVSAGTVTVTASSAPTGTLPTRVQF